MAASNPPGVEEVALQSPQSPARETSRSQKRSDGSNIPTRYPKVYCLLITLPYWIQFGIMWVTFYIEQKSTALEALAVLIHCICTILTTIVVGDAILHGPC
ncbi:protein A9 [Aotine betaherpesvirus 1]|uniref:Protein A9 n=1 Tax=Aotine betaherpesvirus 1 TaxID=50290 RepID=G8XU82_9BETA|nr:protein A9 [Aotine betaherpesvirus 1]AEV80819.1 protein A9 [Aotine betaherpesvirus 1]